MKKLFYSIPKKRSLILLVLGLILCISLEIYATQTSFKYKYKTVPNKYLPSASDMATYQQQASLQKNGAYDLTNSLPSGYVKDGSVDYTTYLQQGIQSHTTIIFPNFPVLINQKGLSLISNSIVLFNKNSSVIMAPNAAPTYRILGVNNVNNVKLYCPLLKGDRNNHIGQKGEWGMGISIIGSSHIEIYNAKISDCWGDGIYIGKENKSNKDIQIYYALLDNNRRNGISITDGNNVKIIHPVISNVNGTAPMAGIDVEPNSNTDTVDNILIDGANTFNNANFGIVLALNRLTGAAQKEVNITINNPIDEYSKYGFCYSVYRKEYNGVGLNGNITVMNPVWKNNDISFCPSIEYKYGPRLEFKNIKVMKNDVIQTEGLNTMKKNLINEKNVIIN